MMYKSLLVNEYEPYFDHLVTLRCVMKYMYENVVTGLIYSDVSKESCKHDRSIKYSESQKRVAKMLKLSLITRS